jgi:hypothetical protein
MTSRLSTSSSQQPQHQLQHQQADKQRQNDVKRHEMRRIHARNPQASKSHSANDCTNRPSRSKTRLLVLPPIAKSMNRDLKKLSGRQTFVQKLRRDKRLLWGPSLAAHRFNISAAVATCREGHRSRAIIECTEAPTNAAGQEIFHGGASHTPRTPRHGKV